MDVSEAEEVKHLRDENGRLKKLVADLSLDKDILRSVIRKKSLSTESGGEALAGGIPGQRASRLRDQVAGIEAVGIAAWFRIGCANWRGRIRTLAIGAFIYT